MSDGRTRKGGGEGSGNCFGTHRLRLPDVASLQREMERLAEACSAGKHQWKQSPTGYVTYFGSRRIPEGSWYCGFCGASK